MVANFKLRSLKDEEIKKVFELSDLELAKKGAIRLIADEFPGFPCRVSL